MTGAGNGCGWIPGNVGSDTGARAFRTSLWELRSNTKFWMIALACGVPVGVSSGWSAVMSINLAGLGWSNRQSAVLGVIISTAGCPAGIIGGWLAGLSAVSRRKKLLVVVMYFVGTCAALVFSC